jgi:hypothetical protein
MIMSTIKIKSDFTREKLTGLQAFVYQQAIDNINDDKGDMVYN